MGYTTTFNGSVSITPPLNEEEIEFLDKFNRSRRMNRKNGPYFVDGNGDFGEDHDSDIIDFNGPPPGQPGLWCQWITNHDGTGLEWDEGEKFYNAAEWMQYIITHFLAPNAVAKSELPFLQANHTVNGEIDAEGESQGDMWKLVVTDNVVTVKQGRIVFD